MVKKPKKAAVKRSKPAVAQPAPVTTIEDLLECGVQFEKRLGEIEARLATLERAELMRSAGLENAVSRKFQYVPGYDNPPQGE